MTEAALKPLGTLIVTVTSKSKVPLGDVSITISTMDGKIVSNLVTDRLGRANTSLEAPAQEIILQKLRQGHILKPYFLYMVTAQHKSYMSVQVVGVQILDKSQVEQEIELPNGVSTNFTTIYIREPELYTDATQKKIAQNPYTIPEPQPGHSSMAVPVLTTHTPHAHFHGHHHWQALPTPTPSQPGVLYELVIPQTVRVHLISKKPDYLPPSTINVPFVEYIKGVMHKEILGFAEEEAIKANVICAVSFTLNRIYTNFYYGKDYDITNDTTIDHDFSPHYSNEEKLTNIVLGYFNEYVPFPEDNILKNQPFLTQYCNGTSITCAPKR